MYWPFFKGQNSQFELKFWTLDTKCHESMADCLLDNPSVLRISKLDLWMYIIQNNVWFYPVYVKTPIKLEW